MNTTSKTDDTEPFTSTPPAIPERAYRNLPEQIQKALSYFDKWYEKDVHLTGLIGVLSACMPNVCFLYGKILYSLHLFVFVLAEAASGKGALAQAFRWAEPIDKALITASQKRIAQWEEQDDDTRGPRPPEVCLLSGEDSTTAKLYERLRDNTYGTLLASTEADAVSAANDRKHGNFSNVLRKAFHHESVGVDRKGSPSIRIENPRLAVVLSGTPRQLWRLISGVEDGLYSRFAVYQYEAPLAFESQRPTKRDREFIEFVEEMQEKVLVLFRQLANRKSALRFEVPSHLWDRVDEEFIHLFNLLFKLERNGSEGAQAGKVSPLLASTVKRGALITFRIAGILAVWRHYEGETDLAKVEQIEPHEEDIEAAIAMGLVYAEHGVRQGLKNGSLPDLGAVGGAGRVTAYQRQFFSDLPDAFTTDQARSVAEDCGISESTLYRWLNKTIEAGSLIREKPGRYRKK